METKIEVGFPADSKPHINWKHVDGPLLCCRDGTPHWLTMQERIWMRLGLTNIEQLDRRYGHYDCKAG